MWSVRNALGCVGAALVLFGGGCSSEEGEAPDAGSGLAVDGGATTNGDGGAASTDLGPVTPGLSRLVIAPETVELVHRSGSASQTYTVTALYSDGTERDLSNTVILSLSNPQLGAMSGATFTTAGVAGGSQLSATWGGLSAEATITVRVDITDDATAGPALPTDPGSTFTNAPTDASRTPPRLVYPLDTALLPPNLAGLEVHFRPGSSSNSLFRVRFEGAGVRLAVHTRCRALEDGCLYALPETLWKTLADSVAGLGPVTISIDGTDDAGTAQSASDPLTVSISARPVEGGLYYWSTSLEAIMRVDFGVQGTPEQFWPPPGSNTTTCYGCHSLSPDGTKMTLSQEGQWFGEMTLVDVASQQRLVQASDGIKEQFQSWAPDSSRFVGVYGDDDPPNTQLRVRDGTTGQVLETIELGTEASHVDWSPAGDKIAYTRVTHHFSSQRPGRGGISYVERTGSAWGAPVELVAPRDGQNHFTPTFAPDGTFLLFAESQCPSGQTYHSSCDGDTDPTAKIWAISPSGGAPIEMANLNLPGPEDATSEIANTYPKWAPFVDAMNADGSGRVMWLTLSSWRRYGLRRREGDNQLLWMAAVDPDAVAAGRDGSFAPFALPFQDLSTSNHIAQWTQRVVPVDPPDGGTGVDGGMCKTRGEACSSSDECCGTLECVSSPAGDPVCERSS